MSHILHYCSITQQSDSTDYSTTRCEATIKGIVCNAPTGGFYFTTLDGERRYVCDTHFRDLLRLIAKHYFMRETYAGMFNEEMSA